MLASNIWREGLAVTSSSVAVTGRFPKKQSNHVDDLIMCFKDGYCCMHAAQPETVISHKSSSSAGSSSLSARWQRSKLIKMTLKIDCMSLGAKKRES
jgi:hypothetical protein